jgi:serine kinase of HPr protein (carbohydrate metabolism regulator)
MIVHAGLVARRMGGRWRGVLIRGPSGAGKSDLALRALDAGFRLVADDRVLVWVSGGALFGRAPPPIAGLIEARGQGVLAEACLPLAQIVLVIDCGGLPDPQWTSLASVRLPCLRMNAFEHSAPQKLRRAMEHLGAAAQRAYQADPLGGAGRAGTGDTP